jgi:hypothetical protein
VGVENGIEKAAGKSLLTEVTAAMWIILPHGEPPQTRRRVIVAGKQKFTRIPKIQYLISQGVPTEVIPTYCALADYSNNKSGLCWPKMETIALTLNRSIRTIQRHVHLLAKLGLIELLERRRHKGRFSSYLYRVIHITRTTGHGRRLASRDLYRKRTKSLTNSQKQEFNSKIDPKDEEARKRSIERKRRTDGYEWLFA